MELSIVLIVIHGNTQKLCKNVLTVKIIVSKKHAYIVDSHRELCNKLITIAKYFPVEKMHFLQAFQKEGKRNQTAGKENRSYRKMAL